MSNVFFEAAMFQTVSMAAYSGVEVWQLEERQEQQQQLKCTPEKGSFFGIFYVGKIQLAIEN